MRAWEYNGMRFVQMLSDSSKWEDPNDVQDICKWKFECSLENSISAGCPNKEFEWTSSVTLFQGTAGMKFYSHQNSSVRSLTRPFRVSWTINFSEANPISQILRYSTGPIMRHWTLDPLMRISGILSKGKFIIVELNKSSLWRYSIKSRPNECKYS